MRKNGKDKYICLWEIYDVLSSGRNFPKYNYKFRIDTIMVVLLRQHMRENLQLKAVCLVNVTISGNKFKNIPVHELGGKVLQSLFKGYQDSLPEVVDSVVFGIFHGIVKLRTMCGESKSGFSKYYFKLLHGKNIFGEIFDRIGEIYLNVSSSIDIIGFRKALKK